jgi:hypothetical protein
LGTDDLFHKRKAKKVRELKAPPKDFIFFCEGEKTEGNYLNGLIKNLCLKYNVDYAKFKPKYEIHGLGKNTISVVKEAKASRYKDYKTAIEDAKRLINQNTIVAIYDKDSFSDENFNTAAQIAEDHNVLLGCSNECFELWLLLHFEYIDAALSRQVIFEKLKVHLGYDNHYKDHKGDENIFDLILEKGGSLENALKNAKKLADTYSADTPYAKRTPCTYMHEVVKKLDKYIEDLSK